MEWGTAFAAIVLALYLSSAESGLARRDAPAAGEYLSNDELESALANLSASYPSMVHLYRLSETSTKGRNLTVIQLGPHAGGERPLLAPMVKYVANMHGNEVVGRELMVLLAAHLLQQYSAGDERVRALLNTTDVHIMPTLNPDGFEAARRGDCHAHDVLSGRTNANQVDLNRDFPDWSLYNASREELLKDRQPETRAAMKWILDNPFVLSINFHDGAVVANYPFDDSPSFAGYSATPDDTLFKLLARTYSLNHADMFMGSGLCESDAFPEGITNGAQWYIVKGGMQDFNYVFSNCFEITLELSCCKFPQSNPLALEWQKNKGSLLRYLEMAHLGVRGLVTDVNNNVVSGARVVVEGVDKHVVTTDRGEYWRLLAPGDYRMRAVASVAGKASASAWKNVSVPVFDVKVTLDTWVPASRVDFELDGPLDEADEALLSPPAVAAQNVSAGALWAMTPQPVQSLMTSVCGYFAGMCNVAAHLFNGV